MSQPPTTDAVDAPPRVTLGAVALDTDEPRRLADFYAALLGWRVSPGDEHWVEVSPPPGQDPPRGGTVTLAFQLVIGYTPPTWPTQGVPQQYHLDLDVDDLDVGERFALALGARRAPASGGEERSFRVFLDPSGHPFCLCRST